VKTRKLSVIALTSFAMCLAFYIFAAMPALILTRHSHGAVAMTTVRIYTPVFAARAHSQLVEWFFRVQWEFWSPILG
jgi:hypothetical protein